MSHVLKMMSWFENVPIRTLISRIGMSIALLVALATPVTFWLVHTSNLNAELEFKARLNAERVARLIFANEQLWQYQALRIAELIELGDAGAQPVHQRVRGASGRVVVESGPVLEAPLAAVTHLIVVRGHTLGTIELSASLWPGINLTLLVGMLSSLLGIGAYLALRILPLSVLDRTMAELDLAQVKLAQKNAELSEFNRNLEQQVAGRTAEASAAAAEARQASKVKSEFLAGMSHEIRTPMNGVLGMADLLTRTQLTTHQQRLVTTINQSARTLLTIINDILDFSRIEAGKFELDAHEFELHQCVESAIEILADDAHKKNLELNLLLPASLPPLVIGDSGRLRQVLVNIIGNAVKFTRQGAVTIRAKECGERNGKSVMQFTVSDTGIGIDPAVQARLFKPFSQADNSISRSFGGTGLGLSIAQNIVQMMDGSVALVSEVGKGTTVTIEILLKKSTRTDYQPIVCPAVIRGEEVLVVDDRPVNREIICNYLEDCGAQIKTASSAEEALSILHANAADNHPIALVVLDMILPGINGFELAQRIKAAPELARTRIIMVTSLSWKGDIQAARDVGIGEFLTKPVRRGDLLEAVRRSYSSAPTAAPAHLAVQHLTAIARQQFSGLRVLLAEDNPVNQVVAREYAMSMGCECQIAENGRLAVEAIATSVFDVVLMDCQMPEMDGLTACRKIRELERDRGLPRTPIIAVTANAYDSDRLICLAADMDDFLAKPFTADQLRAVLTKWQRSPVSDASDGRGSAMAVPGQAASATAESLDSTALQEFENQKSGMAARLAEIFLLTAPKSVRQIMMAIVEGDHDKIRAAAHSLKSASANIGARELQRLATATELQSRNASPMSDCLTTALQLEAEMCKVERMLSTTSWLQGKLQSG